MAIKYNQAMTVSHVWLNHLFFSKGLILLVWCFDEDAYESLDKKKYKKVFQSHQQWKMKNNCGPLYFKDAPFMPTDMTR